MRTRGRLNSAAASDWIASRAPRERVILVVGALTLIVGVFLGGIWRPLVTARAAALQRLEQQDALISTMRSNGAQLKALGTAASPASAVPPATAITQEAATQHITIQRLERDGSQLRVVVDNAEFPALIAWLDRLETAHGLRIAALELDRRPAPGIVSARITLEE